MTEWREVAFEDLLSERVRNGVYKSKEFHGCGVKVVNMKELFAFDRIDDQPELRVELKDAELERFKLQSGDLLFARRSFVLEGSGKCSIVGDPSEATVFESSMIRARVDPRKADAQFLYYLFRSPYGRARMASIATRTAVSGITGSNLAGLRLRVPAPEVQGRISSVLAACDALIENNQRRVEVLEEMARAIYREWLVRFRYPGHEDVPLVDSSSLGPIPDGWRMGCVDDLVTLNKATVDPSSVEPSTPAVGLEHIPRRQITLDDWGEAGDLRSRKGTFVPGDLLFGKIRPYFHKVSVAPVDGICSTDAIVLRPHAEHWGQAVLSIASDEFVAHAVQTSNGTKMPRADWKVIREFPVAVPSTEIARRFSETARGLLAHAQVLMFQDRHLVAIRDLLLPKLVTGQIDVSHPDIDSMTEAAIA